MNKMDLSKFNASNGLDRGRSRFVEILWYLFKMMFFLSAIPWPNMLKVKILRAFGAKVGIGVVIKPRVNIHFPWKLNVGDNSWIGEEVFILNFEEIVIEDNVCVSQRVFLCGGNHDYRDPSFVYRNGKIVLKSGTWIGACCFVGPNVTVGKETVVSACSFVTNNLEENLVYYGNPCVPVTTRWK